MPIEKIIEKSFSYAWKNKAFWFYGVLIALFAGGGYNFGNFNDADIEKVKSNFHPTTEQLSIIFVVLAAVFIFIFLAIIVGAILSSWSSAAIINGTKMLEDSKEISRYNMGKVGAITVWRIIVLRIIIPILIFLALITVLLIPFVGLMIVTQGLVTGLGIFLLVLAIIALIPFLIYLGIVFNLAIPFIVLEKNKPLEALKNSRQLLKGKFWWTLLLVIIFGLITGAASFVALLLFFPALVGLIAFIALKSWIGVIIMLLLAIPFLAIYLLIAGFLTSVTEIGLTLWWLELKKITVSKAVSKSK